MAHAYILDSNVLQFFNKPIINPFPAPKLQSSWKACHIRGCKFLSFHTINVKNVNCLSKDKCTNVCWLNVTMSNATHVPTTSTIYSVTHFDILQCRLLMFQLCPFTVIQAIPQVLSNFHIHNMTESDCGRGQGSNTYRATKIFNSYTPSVSFSDFNLSFNISWFSRPH